MINTAICANLNVTEFAALASSGVESYQTGTEAIVIHPVFSTDYDDRRWFECLRKQNITGEVFIGDGAYLEDIELQDATGVELFENDVRNFFFTEDFTQRLISTDSGINCFMCGQRKCADGVQKSGFF